MTSSLRRRLLQLGSFVLAGGLLALALYGMDVEEMWTAFRQADWRWLVPLVLLVLGSNLFRAWRWQVLIDALPTTPDLTALDGGDPTTSNTLEASFSSIMIGYMVNYVAPRMGEVARTANMAARSDYRFSSLFGTVVSERIFDTAVLGAALLSAIALLFDRLSVLREQFLGPAWTTLSSLPLGWIVGGAAGSLLLVGGLAVLLQYSLSDEHSALAQFWANRVKPALLSFKGGMWTLITSSRRGAILVSTVGMWTGYLLMAYIPFRMLDLAAPYGIGLVDAWCLMAIGALGLLVPTPGGIGSYHYITTVALVHLYGVPEASAFTYAVLAHAAQFVFYIMTGGLALLYQGMGLAVLSPDHPDSSAVEPSQA
ncbi:hypothetical protein BSZ35_04905 [Salinibacter sp. 10B]|uniref:lysylphosphatidylglycerol synthase transmembrane domain-containing protein n=1 Tax=Salinibacter sp. 10B TaxID=1923971 RepID=UPI000CF500BA|nr:lysylphosphatidylglycerol synthase transmembrane domain-containing protein [Salinibacter sp. 10B]PQJ34039.1 hypothetical protein BSZ35_04905 [Salinibacter sp. 10B]